MQKLHIQIYFGLALIFSLITSCVPSPVSGSVGSGGSSLNISFKAVFDSIPVIMGNDDVLFLHNGDSIYFKEFKFFVSNVRLENQLNEDLTPVIDDDEVWQFDMPDDSITAEAGDSKDVLTQPGEYKALSIDFGVPAELNTTVFDPNTFGSASPLAERDNFSTEFGSYKFLELRGEIVGLGTSFNYKVGKEDFYVHGKKYSKSLILTSDTNDNAFEFTIDLKKVLDGITVSEVIDLGEENLGTLGRTLMNNFTQKSITVE